MIDFWALTNNNVLANGEEVDGSLKFVAQRMSSCSESDLIQFDAELRRRLFQIDRRILAEIPVVMASARPFPQTDDHFLYARCACVLGGEKGYMAVLEHNHGFEKFVAPFAQRAEELLYLASDAYEALMGVEIVSNLKFPVSSRSNGQEWI